MSFANTLKSIRLSMGYKTAKGFYLHLFKQTDLMFNYPYYTRMESCSVLPSPAIVSQIANFLDEKRSAILVKSFCQEIFPKYNSIFKNVEEDSYNTQETIRVKQSLLKQQELSVKQIAVIAKSKLHYEIFLMLTLARESFSAEELETLVNDKCHNIIEDFLSVKLLFVDKKGHISSSSAEFRFPSPYNEKLKEAYLQFDNWDKDLKQDWKLFSEKKKFFLRRTSRRQLELVKGFLNQVDELIRSSDEIETKNNNEVILFEYSLNSGKLPG